jgi:hypothetical protein
VVGSKRRRIIALFIFMQALLFGATTPIGTYSVMESTFGDTTFGVLGAGWRVPGDQLAFDQVFALAGALVVAALVWRGLPFAVYSTAALAALSVFFDLVFVAVEAVSFGPLALFFLILFPLPTVPPALIALPILVLSISVILDNQRAKPAQSPKELLVESNKAGRVDRVTERADPMV